jgi:hypothetical protein
MNLIKVLKKDLSKILIYNLKLLILNKNIIKGTLMYTVIG